MPAPAPPSARQEPPRPTDTFLVAALAAQTDPTDADVRRLHDRLVTAAGDARLLDITYRTIDTPVGSLLLAATEIGLVRVAFAVEDHDAVLQVLADRISPRILR